MIEKNVSPIPCEIYRFNKGRRRGDYAWDWPEEKIFRTLCASEMRSAPDGYVILASRKYTSDDLQVVARHHERMNGRKPLEVLVFEIPSAPLHLLWETSDGNLGVLDATGQTKKRFEDDYRWMHDYLTLRANALRRKAMYQNRKRPTVEQVVTKAVVSEATKKKMDDVEKHAHLVEKQGSAVGKRRMATALVEKEHLDAILDRFGKPRSNAPEHDDTHRLAPEYSAVDDEQELNLDF